MGFTQSIRNCLKKYFVFSGRARRSEYWWFVLFVVLVSSAFAILESIIVGPGPGSEPSSGVASQAFQLAVALPVLSAGWRRMHDSGRPGWLLLLPLALSVASAFVLFGGVLAFSILESGVEDPDVLRGPAALLGLGGAMVVYAFQLVLAVLLIWWLTRPSQAGTNEYGPPVS